MTVDGRKTRRDFLQLPYALHARDPIWTPPLQEDLARSLSVDNPLFKDGRGERQLFVLYDGGEPVGRIVAHVHHLSNRRHGEKAGFFGFLECRDDGREAAMLLDAAAEAHRRRGLTSLRGPYELTITQCLGAVTAGFDEPASFSQSWNAPYLPKLLEGAGMKPIFRTSTFRCDDVQAVNPDALVGEKQRAWLAQPDVRLRPFRMERFREDLDAAIHILKESFASNWGFVPMSPEEVEFVAEPMKRVVRPELTVFLEKAGRPVGVGMFLPDFHVLFRRMNGKLFPLGWAKFLLGAGGLKNAVGQFIGTLPELQNQGLMRVIIAELMRALQREGFTTLDGTWVSESNAKSRAQMLAIGMREKHQLAVYERAI